MMKYLKAIFKFCKFLFIPQRSKDITIYDK